MSNYERGRAFEYKCRNKLREKGWIVARMAGSHGAGDLLAGKGGESMMVQCKTDGVIPPKERLHLIETAKEFGATPMLGHHNDKGRIVFTEINGCLRVKS